MSDQLSFPEHAWKQGKLAEGVEVAIDYLPEEHEGRWLRLVEASTADWVSSTGFAKTATLWMWGTMSVNFPQLGMGWSDFVVPVGLPVSFITHLHDDLAKALGQSVRYSQTVSLQRDDGWTAICHIQDRKVWVEEDADLWVVYRSSKDK